MGELLPVASAEKNGFMSVNNYMRMGRNFEKGYRKLVSTSLWYLHYSAFIYTASPASNLGALTYIDWKGEVYSAKLISGDTGNIKLYTGLNPDTNRHELWIGLLGSDGIGSEFIVNMNRNDIEWDSKTIPVLPSYLSVISLS